MMYYITEKRNRHFGKICQIDTPLGFSAEFHNRVKIIEPDLDDANKPKVTFAIIRKDNLQPIRTENLKLI